MTVPPVNSTPRCRPLVARKITARTKVINEMMLNTSAWRMNGMSLRIRKNSIFSSSALDRANPFSGGRMPLVPVGIADRQLFEPAPRTEDQVHHAAGHQHAEEQVIGDNENGDQWEADERGIEPALDVIGAKAGADSPLFDNFHRRRQRTGAQKQCHVACLGGGHAPADLHTAAWNFGTDHWRGNDLALAILHQHHRHALANALARDLLENRGTAAVEIDMTGGCAGLCGTTIACHTKQFP